MASYIVDINTKIIQPTQKIWIVHHGRNANYLATFKNEGAVFLEFPGFSITEKGAEDDSEIRQRIRFAQVVRANKGYVRANNTPILVSDFQGVKGTDVAVHLRTVKHLISRMVSGDLVMVPSRGAGGQVLFGEVAGNYFPQQTIRAPELAYAETPVRRVNWLREWNKTDLTPELVGFYEKPPAIAEVARGRLADQFFDYAYESYAMVGKSWVSVSAPGYDGKDFLSVVEPAQLLALGVSLYRALEQRADITGMSYEDLLIRFYDKNALADAKLAFESPGHYNLKDRDGKLAQFLNVFCALAMAGALTACKAGASVTAHNSVSPNDQSAAGITEMVVQATRPAGMDVLNRVEKQAADAKVHMKLKAPARVTK